MTTGSIINLVEAYEKFCEQITSVNQEGTELKFSAQIEIKKHDLFEAINGMFNTRGFRAFKEKYGYNIVEEGEFRVDNGLFESLWDALTSEVITCKAGYTTQTTLEKMFSDWFSVHYIINSDNDTIDTMSPGKKALVFLELLISLERGNCPILIDQPEDDLDNRSIYTDLVKYLRRKKHDRQIIVVTHNANVVVGADAEEVIIANQDASESRNRARRFEYRSGAIENNDPVVCNGIIVEGVLYEKGIQEQICDILEGGRDAFELRRNKYFRSQ